MMPDPETIGESLARTYKRVFTRIRTVLYHVFTEHPHAQRLSYCQHFTRAARAAFHTGRASCSLAVHSVFPFLFQTTGSTIVHQIHQENVYHKAVLESQDEVERIVKAADASRAATSVQAADASPAATSPAVNPVRTDAELDAELDALIEDNLSRS